MWESGFNYKLQVYLPTKQLLFEDEKADVLGIKTLSISPDDKYISVVTYDDQVIIYNAVSWREIIKFDPKNAEEDENTVSFYLTMNKFWHLFRDFTRKLMT